MTEGKKLPWRCRFFGHKWINLGFYEDLCDRCHTWEDEA